MPISAFTLATVATLAAMAALIVGVKDTSAFSVVSPAAGDRVYAGSLVDIVWTTGYAASTARVVLVGTTSNSTIVQKVAFADGRYQWAVPASQSGGTYQIVVVVNNAHAAHGLSGYFEIVNSSDADSLLDHSGPYLGIGLVLLLLITAIVMYILIKCRAKRRHSRRARHVEMHVLLHDEHLTHEFVGKHRRLWESCGQPYSGGMITCGSQVWTYQPSSEPGAGSVVCKEGPLSGHEFLWIGSDMTGLMELRCDALSSTIGFAEWDGKALRWRSPVRVRVRGNGFAWRYTSKHEGREYVLDGRARGVSFADEPRMPQEDAPLAPMPIPDKWVVTESGLRAVSRTPVDFPADVSVTGSVPPMVTMTISMLKETQAEITLQRNLFTEQRAIETRVELSKRRNRALKLFGRIQFVTRLADVKVQIVPNNPDIQVQLMDCPGVKPGEWQIVDDDADFTVQTVDHGGDFTVQFVNSDPGVLIPDVV